MTKPTIGAEWQAYAEDLPESLAPEQLLRLRRAFYSGAAAMLTLADRKADFKAARQDIVFFGRQVGHAHEAQT